MTVALIFAFLGCIALVVYLIVKGKLTESEEARRREFVRAETQQKQAEIERKEVERQNEVAKKVEAIKNEQIENHDKATDFDGSIDVLSDIASRNRNSH